MASSSPPESGPVLSVRIVSHDYYMAPPIPDIDFSFSSFHGRKIEEVPIIRIHGSTPAGQKTCLHVHKVLPYLYIPCPDELLHNSEPQKGNSYLNSFLTALEKALKTRGTSKKQHVHGCAIVKAKKMYGYFPKEELFIKIYLYYPHDVSRASTLLLSGVIMSRQFQPYESHIPYILQFLIDYNLYGMGHIHVSNMKFRPPVPDTFTKSVSTPGNFQAGPDDYSLGNVTIWISSTISRNLLWDNSITENFASRQSISMLEADSCVDDILNEKQKMYTSLSQTTSDVKMVQSLIPIWEEFIRSGLQEEVNPPDISKPEPETILTSFMNDFEYGSIIAKLNPKEETSLVNLSPAEEEEIIEQRIKSLSDVCGSVAFGKSVESYGMNLKDDELIGTSEVRNEAEEMQHGGQSTSQEHMNKEALGLLNWLASSQAANDVTSDDELTNEAILTPLFPQRTYQTALEAAHQDFETVSVKECQDILDSVEIHNTRSKESSSSTSGASDDFFVIPQVDGSTDEQEHVTPDDDKDMKKNVKRSREKRSPWGVLPISAKKREVGIGSSSSASPFVDSNLNPTNCEADMLDSVRDLMRKQRFSRSDVVCRSANSMAMLDSELSSKELDNNPIERREGFIEMTYMEKPPSREQIQYSFCQEPTTNAAGPGVNDVHPFFSIELESGKEEANKYFPEEQHHKEHPTAALGVPTHFKNDGSVLYLLTQPLSPPSHESVSQWLIQEGKQNIKSDQIDCNLPQKICITESKIVTPESSPSKELKESISSEVKGKKTDVNVTSSWNNEFSQISGPDDKGKLTPISQIGFQDPASVGGGQQLTILSLEVLAECRGDLQPDPKFDAINIVSLCVQDDSVSTTDTYVLVRGCSEEYCRRNADGVFGCNFIIFPEERHLFEYFIDIIMSSLDPDILIGWEVQRGSLGFLAERAAHLGINLLKRISRIPILDKKLKITKKSDEEASSTSMEDVVDDEWGRTHASGVHVGGRIVLNLWRLMRGEVKINMYTMEAVVEEVLRRKVPLIPCSVLNKWFASGPRFGRHRSIEYVIDRARIDLELINHLDMINRTSELARVFGIDFFSVLSRGSQFRVESMLMRLAHTQNYLAISPGSQQVALQPAMECLPLVMEPESGFYTDPVVVLDFQSLYPSMIIAYNLCYSTCLGKVYPSRSTVLGVSSYQPDSRAFSDLKNELLLAPNGVLYVQSKVRKGVLPRLLQEILSTRVMVKQAMKKLCPSQQVLHRIYNARQLALKLIANVTYGYTAAGFSGRMPCAELADSIVQCGRRTLETAILFVNQHPRWNARVIYGDTDSMFVLLKGQSMEEAFKIGKEIASSVTMMNPEPVTLKLEKVYQPCFLLTKKRYVGYSYESPDQKEPTFDAKGIETVRRDTCPAVAKILEKSIRIMFEHQDITKVKSYLERQWTRILSGKISLQDFIFAKEVRLGTYSTRAATLPPSAIIAMKYMSQDPRSEPQYGERVPYVVVHGEPGARLVDMVIDPYLLLEPDSPYRLNDMYYINKQIIPVLQRVFGLVGADLFKWFADIPRPVRRTLKRSLNENNRGGRIDRYYVSKHCLVCGKFTKRSDYLCDDCVEKEDVTCVVLVGRAAKLEREMQHLNDICRHCGGADWKVESGIKCISLACSVFYERRKVQKDLRDVSKSAANAGYFPQCMADFF